MSDIIVGSVGVRLVPDATGFPEKAKALTRGLTTDVTFEPHTEDVDKKRQEQEHNPVKIPVAPDKLDVFGSKIKTETAAIAKAAAMDIPLTADGEQLRRDVTAQVGLINELVKVDIPVDLEDAAALRNKMALELDILKAMADSAHPTVHVDVEADTAAANAKLDYAARDRKSTILPDVSGFGMLTTLGIGLGPALIPAAAAAGGLVAALGAPLAAAGGGATLYGLIAGKAVASTEKQSKVIDELHKKVLSAQQAVAKASTPAGKRSAMATLATDTKAYHDALGALAPEQRKFITAQGDLKAAFAKLEHTAGPAIFGPLVKGMDDLSTILPKLTPVLNPVSKAIGGLLDEVDRSAQHGALKDFIGFLSATSGPAITKGGHILGNIAVGFGSIGKAFEPVGKSVGNSLVDWSKGFSHIGESKGLHDFVGYVHKEGPKVATTLRDVGSAAGHIVKAVAPIGDVSLKIIDGLAKGIDKIRTKDLTIAAGGFALIAVSVKAIGLANKGIGALNKIPGVNIGRGTNPLTGGIASKATPVPVYVTNEGFGAPGGTAGGAGTAVGEGAAVGGGILSKLAGALMPFAGGAGLGLTLNSMGLNPFSHEGGQKAIADPGWDRYLAQQHTKMLRALDIAPAMRIMVAGVGKEFARLPKQVQTKVLTPGATDSIASVKSLIKTYDLTPKQKQTLFKVLGATEGASTVRALKQAIDGLHDKTINITTVRHDSFASKQRGISGARASGGPVSAGLSYLVGENAPEVFTPATSGRVDPISHGSAHSSMASLHGTRLRLVVGDSEFDAYVDARADDRVDAAAGLIAQTGRAG